jgi:hypothetical protein
MALLGQPLPIVDEYSTIPLLEARFSELVKHRRLSSVATYL